ncbi:hypothetical protein C5F52_29065 [Limnohabitans sp. TS-CS-82]|uniref:YkvA family protein n=1 Tax=Limnohabitans sp. TS-CS-82 TaxID=2094193 RepID=UPI000CF1CC44|nr:YkvA family protein [Limnohabitans sp. TS-CS-82]PQA79658.1 hypothetical protein C5F52_29065 [Limnohabitans sp. TS-CS-82]
MRFLQAIRVWAKKIKRDSVTLWFAEKHPCTPKLIKFLGMFVVAYALSPIDLIPDFIPVLGYLDDVILLPALTWLTVKLLPMDILIVCQQQADDWMQEKQAKPTSRWGIVLVVSVWAVTAVVLWNWVSF